MFQRVIVTGGEGFIGSNFVKLLWNETDYDIVNLDERKYSGRGNNIDHMGLIGNPRNPRYQSVQGDICDSELLSQLILEGDIIVNFAAESHVDRSLSRGSAEEFMTNNAVGAINLLEEALTKGVRKFVQISTDEVYGSLELDSVRKFKEGDETKSGNPYSASKAAAEQIALAYHNSYGLPVVITRSSNNYGRYQFPEKFIPVAVTNLLEGKKIPIYGKGLNVRDWIHVEDNCRAILKVMENGRNGEIYNIGGGNEISNIDLVCDILDVMHLDGNTGRYYEFVQDREGHDLRYALDNSKIRQELQWKPQVDFKEGLKRTIEWYKENETWWRALKPEDKK